MRSIFFYIFVYIRTLFVVAVFKRSLTRIEEEVLVKHPTHQAIDHLG